MDNIIFYHDYGKSIYCVLYNIITV